MTGRPTETDRAGDAYFIEHEDGCHVGGARIEAGDELYFVTEAGDILYRPRPCPKEERAG